MRGHLKDYKALERIGCVIESPAPSSHSDVTEKKSEAEGEKYWASGTGFGTGEGELQIQTSHWSQSPLMSAKEKRDLRIAMCLLSTRLVLRHLETTLQDDHEDVHSHADVTPNSIYRQSFLLRLLYSSPLLGILATYVNTGIQRRVSKRFHEMYSPFSSRHMAGNDAESVSLHFCDPFNQRVGVIKGVFPPPLWVCAGGNGVREPD